MLMVSEAVVKGFFAEWERKYRAGECITQEEASAKPAEQVVTEHTAAFLDYVRTHMKQGA